MSKGIFFCVFTILLFVAGGASVAQAGAALGNLNVQANVSDAWRPGARLDRPLIRLGEQRRKRWLRFRQ